ncbi:hypothetical protein TGME49_239070 [Toxoplasma gondii ME49]|uniref:C2H2 type zinc-finger protein n=3 Tax=Toxoplasma gondii TaxID=5811 RepID=A0A125YUH2_TOXGV|nr:hypothetical protein TGME49_239070 [Toxoplasma gondii ME49]EPT30813.1 hypothetical protein TGME49_239070 [Toxoplasma gondii ME49]ESS31319.1 C2H2 type zinc-finger protein [Toxoplasma gondii VEG]CEL73287.1 TPA: zinc finger (C2H2 type) protein, putative [Toxoplasma gondii VEG]|eukprot:XP_018637678.1 hypothetical protein TGME49_239070 [Toxoplasma gondii ME49]
MEASVDGGRAPPSSPPSAFACRCCRVSFSTLTERKEHQRSDWHSYNQRRSVGNLGPVTQEEFSRKIQVALFASQLKQDKSGDKEAHIDAAVRLHRTLLNSSVHAASPVASSASPLASSSSSSLASSASPLPPTERERAQAVATLTALGVLASRGEDHLKGKKAEKAGPRPLPPLAASETSRGAATDGAASVPERSGARGISSEAQQLEKKARLAALATSPECVSLFDLHAPFASWRENLTYMQKTFSFALPHAEFLVDPARFLRIIWKAQMRKPRCLWCMQRFASVEAAQQHMQSKGHTQLRWADSADSALQRALEPCFDFRASYLALLERRAQLAETQKALSHTGDRRDREPEETLDEIQETQSADEDLWEDVSDDDSDSWTVASEEAAEPSDVQKKPRGDIEDEYARLREECKGLTDKDFRRILRQCGDMQARLTETGDLRLPDGRELVNRHVAYIYKQRLGRRVPGDAEAQVLADAYGVQSLRDVCGGERGALALASSHCPGDPAQRKAQLALRLRQEKHRRLLACLGRSGRGLSEKQLRTQREVKHRVVLPREQFAKRMQKQRMQLGVKQNTLQKFILQEHKFFL